MAGEKALAGRTPSGFKKTKEGTLAFSLHFGRKATLSGGQRPPLQVSKLKGGSGWAVWECHQGEIAACRLWVVGGSTPITPSRISGEGGGVTICWSIFFLGTLGVEEIFITIPRWEGVACQAFPQTLGIAPKSKFPFWFYTKKLFPRMPRGNALSREAKILVASSGQV